MGLKYRPSTALVTLFVKGSQIKEVAMGQTCSWDKRCAYGI